MGSGTGPRVLVVATKCPWPATDGGRLVLNETLRAVAEAGAEITLVSPPAIATVSRSRVARAAESDARDDGSDHDHSGPGIDPARLVPAPQRLRSWISTLLRPGTPATILRQTSKSAIDAVARLVAERTFDVAHAEQLHSLPMLEPARKRGIPIVLRAQNVESDLWTAAARSLPLAAPWLLLQASLLRRWEGRAVAEATVTAALTASDTWRLSNLARRRGEVVHVAAPFPRSLPAGAPLPGRPAVVVAAGGWIPNHEGARWFLQSVWPLVLERLPGAHLHLFGARGARLPPRTTAHEAAPDSIDLFPAEGIHVVPIRFASGVRMKILEAWARQVPVVATAAAAAGLDDGADRALLQETDPAAIALTIETLAHDPDLRSTLVAEGSRQLARHHDPATIAARWIDLYRFAAQRAGTRAGS